MVKREKIEGVETNGLTPPQSEREHRRWSCVTDAWTVEEAEEGSCEVISLVLMSR
jgi:hypothetical protein